MHDFQKRYLSLLRGGLLKRALLKRALLKRALLRGSAFGVLALSLCLSCCAKKIAVADVVRPVRVIELSAHQQHVMAEYSGNVQPRIDAKLGFRVSGKISARKVDVGTLVKAGQILMQIDAADLRLSQLQAEGNFKAAQSNLELATNELKRYQELRKTNAISQSMLDAKITALAAAQGNFEQGEALAKGQSNQTAYANLVATSSGVVTEVNAEVGQVVSAGMPVIRVAQLGEMEVVVGIPENNVDIVNRANNVNIHLWANPQESITGKVRELSPIADPATRTFIAKVSIVNPSAKVAASIKMGMTANVQFVLNTPSAFMKVPLTALFEEQGATSVWIVEAGAVKRVPVQVVGVSGNDLLLSATVVKEGAASSAGVEGVIAGQKVVTAGVHLLTPGQRVTILEAAASIAVNTSPYLSAQTLLMPAPVMHSGAEKSGAEKSGALKSGTVKSGALK